MDMWGVHAVLRVRALVGSGVQEAEFFAWQNTERRRSTAHQRAGGLVQSVSKGANGSGLDGLKGLITPQ